MASVKELLEKHKGKSRPFSKPWHFDIPDAEENCKQTVNKPDTNVTQTQHKRNTNLTQPEAKPDTNVTQTQHKHNTNITQNLTQTRHKLDTDTTRLDDVLTLSGGQKKIINLIYNDCRARRAKVTSPLTTEYISKHLKITPGSVKTTIQRLLKKQFISREICKAGRGGWVIYRMPNNVYNTLLDKETRHKPDTEPNTEPDTNGSSSSRYNITTTENGQTIDIKPLAKIGFTENHLKQVLDAGKLTAEQIQASIERYAYDLYKNDKVNKIAKPINYFIKVLKLGHEYAEPEGYESEETKLLRENIERLERQQAEREANLRRLEDLKFNEWYEGLGIKEKEALRAKFSAITRGKDEGHPMVKGEFKNYFKNEVRND